MALNPVNRRQMVTRVAAGLLCPARVAAQPYVGVSHESASRLTSRPELPYEPPTSLRTVTDIYRRMTAPIRVDGQGPYPFVVDTGANQSVISLELAAQLGLPRGPDEPLNGVAGIQMTPTTRARLDVGRRPQTEVVLSMLPAQAIGGAGMLGLDGLENEVLTLDFRGQALRIEAPRRRFGDPDEITLQARRRDGQLTLVDADLAGLHLTAFLDSGAQDTIGNLALLSRASNHRTSGLWTHTPIVSATGQTISAQMAELPNLRVGRLRLPNWPVAFADLHTFQMWNLIDQPAILLGVDVMSRFEYVCLDFSRDEVRFRLPQG
ncbi:MAG TPA: aspartyl protease family protein [Caulobacteraceae bacterium]|nr:aspartyl protease family protein [Caulobacteraceae bacterium]